MKALLSIALLNIRKWYWRRKIKRAAKLLLLIDKIFLKGASRQARRQFWREFSKDKSFREELFNLGE